MGEWDEMTQPDQLFEQYLVTWVHEHLSLFTVLLIFSLKNSAFITAVDNIIYVEKRTETSSNLKLIHQNDFAIGWCLAGIFGETKTQ